MKRRVSKKNTDQYPNNCKSLNNQRRYENFFSMKRKISLKRS